MSPFRIVKGVEAESRIVRRPLKGVEWQKVKAAVSDASERLILDECYVRVEHFDVKVEDLHRFFVEFGRSHVSPRRRIILKWKDGRETELRVPKYKIKPPRSLS